MKKKIFPNISSCTWALRPLLPEVITRITKFAALAVLSTSLIQPCLGALFIGRPYTTGDTTVQWDVTGSMGVGGLLTATTTTTPPNNSPPFNGFRFTSGGIRAGFLVDEGPPRDIVWSFIGNSSFTGVRDAKITYQITSLAAGNVYSFSQPGIVIENGGNNFFKDPGRIMPYSVGDTLGAVYSNNDATDFRFTSTEFGTISFAGGSPGLAVIGSVAFDFNIIPEPSGIALLGVGSFVFLLRRRR